MRYASDARRKERSAIASTSFPVRGLLSGATYRWKVVASASCAAPITFGRISEKMRIASEIAMVDMASASSPWPNRRTAMSVDNVAAAAFTTVLPSRITDSVIGERASVGPFSAGRIRHFAALGAPFDMGQFARDVARDAQLDAERAAAAETGHSVMHLSYGTAAFEELAARLRDLAAPRDPAGGDTAQRAHGAVGAQGWSGGDAEL